HSLGMALGFAAMLHQFRREPRAVEEIAEATVALATEHGLQQWIVTGTFLRGWAMMALGRRDGGLARMAEAYAAYRALGLALNQPWWIDMLAEAYAAAGQPAAGLSLLEEAAQPLISLGVGAFGGFHSAEVLRRRGLLLLGQARNQAHVAEAEGCFRSAL